MQLWTRLYFLTWQSGKTWCRPILRISSLLGPNFLKSPLNRKPTKLTLSLSPKNCFTTNSTQDLHGSDSFKRLMIQRITWNISLAFCTICDIDQPSETAPFLSGERLFIRKQNRVVKSQNFAIIFLSEWCIHNYETNKNITAAALW